jgi:hypothetical protein
MVGENQGIESLLVWGSNASQHDDLDTRIPALDNMLRDITFIFDDHPKDHDLAFDSNQRHFETIQGSDSLNLRRGVQESRATVPLLLENADFCESSISTDDHTCPGSNVVFVNGEINPNTSNASINEHPTAILCSDGSQGSLCKASTTAQICSSIHQLSTTGEIKEMPSDQVGKEVVESDTGAPIFNPVLRFHMNLVSPTTSNMQGNYFYSQGNTKRTWSEQFTSVDGISSSNSSLGTTEVSLASDKENHAVPSMRYMATHKKGSIRRIPLQGIQPICLQSIPAFSDLLSEIVYFPRVLPSQLEYHTETMPFDSPICDPTEKSALPIFSDTQSRIEQDLSDDADYASKTQTFEDPDSILKEICDPKLHFSNRNPRDLYKPLWIRGTGRRREGRCELCNPPIWLNMKKSTYWYHMNFIHGINSKTGRNYQKPEEYRLTLHMLPQKSEYCIQGRCHQCNDWILIETVQNHITDVYQKSPFLISMDPDSLKDLIKTYFLWYKHAQKCHSNIEFLVSKSGTKKKSK